MSHRSVIQGPAARCGLIIGLLALAGAAAAASDDARSWLGRMQTALVDVDYRGEFSYFRDGQLSSLAITHARIGGIQHERLVHLDGPRREILRDGAQVVCMLEAGDPMLDVVDQIPPGAFARAFIPGDAAQGAVPVGYAARVTGAGRIAGEPAVRIDIRPDDATRYGYRLWLHDPSAMPLRAELVGDAAGALEIFQFVHIDIGTEVTEQEFEPSPGAGLVQQHLMTAAEAEAAADAPPADAAPTWEAGWLPKGFHMAHAALRTMPDRPAPVQTLRYSDGLASLSVFVEPVRAEATWAHRRSRGATSAVMRELEIDSGDRYLVTVVGEVPMATAERIAAAVRPRS